MTWRNELGTIKSGPMIFSAQILTQKNKNKLNRKNCRDRNSPKNSGLGRKPVENYDILRIRITSIQIRPLPQLPEVKQ